MVCGYPLSEKDEESSKYPPPVKLLSSNTNAIRLNLTGENPTGTINNMPRNFTFNPPTSKVQKPSNHVNQPPQTTTTPASPNPPKSTGLFQYNSPRAIISTSNRSTPYGRLNRTNPPASHPVSTEKDNKTSNE